MTFTKYKASILLSSLGRVMHLNKIAHLTDTPLRGLLLHSREIIPYCYAHGFPEKKCYCYAHIKNGIYAITNILMQSTVVYLCIFLSDSTNTNIGEKIYLTPCICFYVVYM